MVNIEILILAPKSIKAGSQWPKGMVYVQYTQVFSGNVLWKIEQDKEGFASLIKYRLTAEK